MTTAISDLIALCQAMKPVLASQNAAVASLRAELMQAVAIPIYEKAIEAAGSFGGEDQNGARRGDFSTYQRDRDERFTTLLQRVATKYNDTFTDETPEDLTALAFMTALNEEAVSFIEPATTLCEIVNRMSEDGDNPHVITEALRVFFAVKYLGLHPRDVPELRD